MYNADRYVREQDSQEFAFWYFAFVLNERCSKNLALPLNLYCTCFCNPFNYFLILWITNVVISIWIRRIASISRLSLGFSYILLILYKIYWYIDIFFYKTKCHWWGWWGNSNILFCIQVDVRIRLSSCCYILQNCRSFKTACILL